MKLTISSAPDAAWDNKVLLVIAKLLQLEDSVQIVATDDKELLKKSMTGRFPFLQQEQGLVICEHLPIARVLSKDHPLFNGASENDHHQVNMWADHINATVAPFARRIIAQCQGQKSTMDLKQFSMASSDLKNSLASIENHLKLRNFLVGHSLSLADVLLVGILAHAFSCAVDKKTRDATLPNIQRYVSLVLQMPAFEGVYGQVPFCKDASFVPVGAEQK